LISKAISLPKPAYPTIAIQIRAQGPVNVQILVDEQGKVISAHAVKGNPMFLRAAEEAALRARFTPTLFNDQPVKVQGVIIYNFVLR
jgi:TonB family protein